MAVNATPLGAAKLPLTGTLNTAALAVRMSRAKPMMSPTAHLLP
jgi:hypothetical protein